MLEHRFYELREADLDKRLLNGVAVSYTDVAKVRHFEERFLPGAFAGHADNVILTYMHDRQRPLTRTGAGLTLHDGEQELRFSAVLPKTRDADDCLELVRAGVMRGASVSFQAIDDEWNGTRREIRQAHLSRIGVVDEPAYPASVVEARFAEMEEEDRLIGAVAALVGKQAAKKIGQKVIAPRLLSLAERTPATAALARSLDDLGAIDALGLKRPGPGFRQRLINTLEEETELIPGFRVKKGNLLGYVVGNRIGQAIAPEILDEPSRPFQSLAPTRRRPIL